MIRYWVVPVSAALAEDHPNRATNAAIPRLSWVCAKIISSISLKVIEIGRAITWNGIKFY